MQTPIQETVRLAVALLTQHPPLDDAGVVELLVQSGVALPTAHDLTAFVPLGFTRALLGTSGVTFQPTYVRIHPHTQTPTRYRLADEPIFVAAYALGQQMMAPGSDRAHFFAVAGRSAEMRALNQALHAGSKIEDLVCSEPMFLDHAAMPPPEQP